jgi:hypothetical protein
VTTFTNIYRGSQPVRSASLYTNIRLLPFKTDTNFPTALNDIRARAKKLKSAPVNPCHDVISLVIEAEIFSDRLLELCVPLLWRFPTAFPVR